MMKDLLLVAVGGGSGAVCRHLISLAGLRLLGSGFPWGTLCVNVVGSLLMGLFIEVLAQRLSGATELRYLIATGFLGGFTTFSTFSLDATVLWERGEPVLTVTYVVLSLMLSVGALFGGLHLMRHVLT